MDKFIEFNGGVFNTRHIIALVKCNHEWEYEPKYGIELYVTGDIERQHFNEEYERDTVFNHISKELLNI